MKLFYTPASPFVRKVLVVAHEVGLADRLEIVPAVLTPVAPDALLLEQNPLGKVPALVTDDGEVVYDSRVIVDLLDRMHDGPRLVPPTGTERTRVLRTEALADGILDAGLLVRYESALRPAEHRWPAWTDAQRAKVERGLDTLERAVGPGDVVDLGTIAAACALGWLLFRKPVDGIATRWPALFAFHERFATRASMRATAPHDPPAA